MMYRMLARLGFVAALLGAPPLFAADAPAAETEVIVLTSYPEEMTVRYEEAFARAHPDIRLRIVWQQGRDAIATLRGPGRGGIDVYWSPAAFNFPTLADEGAFAPLAADRAVLPGRIGAQPVSDARRRYEAFEVAGYGLALSDAALAARKLTPPRRWDDLAAPAFRDLVVMPVPSRVGFAPGLYDVILQDKGWSAGWALLSEIAANAHLAARGGQILAPVIEGRAAAALAIDFLPRNAVAEGQPLRLVYPARTAFLPAYVALVAEAPHREAARTFADFVLSAEGQALLFAREINRYPVRPEVYAKAPPGTLDPFAVPEAATFAYDFAVGPARAPLIAALFDAAIAARHDTLRALWAAIHAAEAKESAAAKEARALAGWVPVTDAEAADPAAFARLVAQGAKDWAAALDERHARAMSLLRD